MIKTELEALKKTGDGAKIRYGIFSLQIRVSPMVPALSEIYTRDSCIAKNVSD